MLAFLKGILGFGPAAALTGPVKAWLVGGAVALALAALAASHVAAYRLGAKVARGDCAAAELAATAAAIETLTGRLDGARARAASLETALSGLRAAAAAARKDVANVLPKDDAHCDLPPAARRLLDRASGYDDPMPDLGGARP